MKQLIFIISLFLSSQSFAQINTLNKLYRYGDYNLQPLIQSFNNHFILAGTGMYNDRFSDSLQDYPITFKGVIQNSNFQGDSIFSTILTHEDSIFYNSTGRFPSETISGMCIGYDNSIYYSNAYHNTGNTIVYNYNINWMKSDSMGNLLNRVAINNPPDTVFVPRSINYLMTDDLAICGNIRDTVNYFDRDGLIAIVDTQGVLQRYYTYKFGSSPTIILNAYRTSDGGFVGSGVKDFLNPPSNCYAVIFKIDSTGQTVWEQSLDNNYYSYPGNLVKNSSGDFLLYYMPRFYPAGSNIYAENRLLKFTEQGNIIWDKTLNVTRQMNCGGWVSLLPDDRIFTCGAYYDTIVGAPSTYGYMILLDTASNMMWQRNYVYDTGTIDSVRLKGFYSGQPTPDGGFIAAGENYCCNFSVPWNSYSSSFWVVKTDSLGLITGMNGGLPAYLSQSYLGLPTPNPAQKFTKLSLAIPSASHAVTLEVFSMDSRKLESIPIARGQEEIVLDVNLYAKGIYVLALNVDGFSGGIQKLVVE
jgi:hypothetical protein